MPGKNTLRRLTNGDFFQIFDQQWVFSQEASVSTSCRVLHHQQLDLFTIVSSSRKFAECLYCDVSPPPILPVLSRFIESPVIYSLYNHTFIHTSIHSYNHASIFIRLYVHSICTTSIHTFIHPYIHASILSCMHTQYIHNIIHTWPHQFAQSLVWYVIPSMSGQEMSLNFHLLKYIIPRF